MLLEELKKKVENKEATENDLFDYFQVKNIEGLESLLDLKMSGRNNQNKEYMYNGFKYIYQQRVNSEFNPLEERYMLLAIAAKALYNFDLEEFTMIFDILGVFNAIFILNNIMEEKEEYRFFVHLYKEYVNSKEGFMAIADTILDKLVSKLDSVMKDTNIEDIQKLLEEFNKKADEIKK